MRLLILLLALTAASQSRAQMPPQDFCASLKRTLEAAGRPQGLAAMEMGRSAPPHFGFHQGCGRTGDDRQSYWFCSQHLAPDYLSRDRLAERVTDCRPDARLLDSDHGGERRFRLPEAEIRIFESGGPGAQVGRVVTFVVVADPAE